MFTYSISTWVIANYNFMGHFKEHLTGWNNLCGKTAFKVTKLYLNSSNDLLTVKTVCVCKFRYHSRINVKRFRVIAGYVSCITFRKLVKCLHFLLVKTIIKYYFIEIELYQKIVFKRKVVLFINFLLKCRNENAIVTLGMDNIHRQSQEFIYM